MNLRNGFLALTLMALSSTGLVAMKRQRPVNDPNEQEGLAPEPQQKKHKPMPVAAAAITPMYDSSDSDIKSSADIDYDVKNDDEGMIELIYTLTNFDLNVSVEIEELMTKVFKGGRDVNAYVICLLAHLDVSYTNLPEITLVKKKIDAIYFATRRNIKIMMNNKRFEELLQIFNTLDESKFKMLFRLIYADQYGKNLDDVPCFEFFTCTNPEAKTQLPCWINAWDNDCKTVLFSQKYLQDVLLWLPSIFSFCGIYALDLSNNELTNLPKEICLFSNLEALALEKNDLGFLPTQIGYLSKLKIFNVSNNHLQAIPDSMSALGELEGLILNANELTEIPTCLLSLGSLKTLGLYYNDFSDGHREKLFELFNHIDSFGV